MKKLLLGAASAVALLTAGNAFAAGNASTIDQIGYDNSAAVDQTSSPSDAVAQITQGSGDGSSDAYNSASVTQGHGAGNQASITQSQGGFGAVSNPSNVSDSDQQGADGGITVVQVGNNSSSITQTSGSNQEHALVGQSGDSDVASIEQKGVQELVVVNQEEGNGNSASIVQAGTGNADYTATTLAAATRGPNNLHWLDNVPSDSVLPGVANGDTVYGPVGAVVNQNGSNNAANINQAGYQNWADVAQGNQDGDSNNTGSISQGSGQEQSDAVEYQDGHNDVASISQSGSGSSYSTVWQYGNSNQAYSTQDGSEHSVIGQGVTGDEVGFANTVSGDYASVDQTKDGDNSLVTQVGDNDTAYVSQTHTTDAMSTVIQGGSYNVANVRQ